MMKLLLVLVLVPLLLSGCGLLQKTAMFSANDTASAAAIAASVHMDADSRCWSGYTALLSTTEKQLDAGNGGVASTLALQRAFKAVASRPECSDVTVEFLTALGKIPYAGPIAIQLFGF